MTDAGPRPTSSAIRAGVVHPGGWSPVEMRCAMALLPTLTPPNITNQSTRNHLKPQRRYILRKRILSPSHSNPAQQSMLSPDTHQFVHRVTSSPHNNRSTLSERGGQVPAGADYRVHGRVTRAAQAAVVLEHVRHSLPLLQSLDWLQTTHGDDVAPSHAPPPSKSATHPSHQLMVRLCIACLSAQRQAYQPEPPYTEKVGIGVVMTRVSM